MKLETVKHLAYNIIPDSEKATIAVTFSMSNRLALHGTETMKAVYHSSLISRQAYRAKWQRMPSGGIERGLRTLRRTPAEPNWCCASGYKPRWIYHTQRLNVPMLGTG